MDVERIFSADQIEVHPGLSQILKDFTKAVIRANPDDVLAFSERYFQQKLDASRASADGENYCLHYCSYILVLILTGLQLDWKTKTKLRKSDKIRQDTLDNNICGSFSGL